MSNTVIKPWVESVELHPDVLSPDFSEDIFALDLGPLADGNKNVPAVYRDAEQFVRASYLTNGLRSLLQDVLSRLAGGGGNRVLKLITPFGGGKSHTLASLFHAARKREAFNAVPEGKALPKPGKVRTAVFDGQFFSPANGKDLPGGKGKVHTLWGWIAWSLAGQAGYDIIRKDDDGRVAPGGDDVLKLLGDEANLILLDEVLEYLISAGGIKVHDTTLRDETLSFIKRLTVAVGNTPQSVLVFSLQSSKRESLDYINLLQTLDHLAARKDQRREPVEGNEVLRVIQRRLLGKMPTEADSTPAATAYQEVVTAMRRAYAKTPAEQQQAEQEGIELRDRIRAAYPFHPALIDLMRERWAAITDFQRTRGTLRFLAACLRAAHGAGASPACAAAVAAGRRAVLGPGDVPLHDPNVRLAFFKEVGQQSDFQACLEHDFVGANARAWRIDERRAKEFPAESLKRPATRIATDILEKFGDKPRQFRNGLGLAVPAADQIEVLRRAVRYLLAIERVKSKAKQHNLTEEQKSQLRERECTEKAAAESAFLKLYTEVWLPKVEGAGIGIEAVAVGGRPLQTTLSEKKEALIHERVLELVMQVQKRVFDSVTPGKVVEFFKLGEGTPPKLGITTGDLVTGFYSFLVSLC
jgi:predicted AAA+ superfamily ATPase